MSRIGLERHRRRPQSQEISAPHAKSEELSPPHAHPQTESSHYHIANRPRCASQQTLAAHVRFGSKADMVSIKRDVRHSPKSGHSAARRGCLVCARIGVIISAELIVQPNRRAVVAYCLALRVRTSPSNQRDGLPFAQQPAPPLRHNLYQCRHR
jgi:hypothetical protein